MRRFEIVAISSYRLKPQALNPKSLTVNPIRHGAFRDLRRIDNLDKLGIARQQSRRPRPKRIERERERDTYMQDYHAGFRL